MSEIIRSISHKEFWDALADQENKGPISTHKVTFSDKAKKTGVVSIPDTPTEVYKVKFGGVDGFLYKNPMDDYYRADFFPVEECVDLGKIREVTPVANRLESGSREKDRAEKDKSEALLEAQERTRNYNSSRAEMAFEYFSKVNNACGLPIFEIPSTIEEYKEEVISDGGLTIELGLSKRIAKANVIDSLVNEAVENTGVLPVLVLENNGESELYRTTQVYNQLEEHRIASKYGCTFEVVVTEPNAAGNQSMVVSVLSYENGTAGNRLGLWELPLVRDDVTYTVDDEYQAVKTYAIDYYNAIRFIEGSKSIPVDESAFHDFIDDISLSTRFAFEEEFVECAFEDVHDFAVVEFTRKAMLQTMENIIAVDAMREIVCSIQETMAEKPETTVSPSL